MKFADIVLHNFLMLFGEIGHAPVESRNQTVSLEMEPLAALI